MIFQCFKGNPRFYISLFNIKIKIYKLILLSFLTQQISKMIANASIGFFSLFNRFFFSLECPYAVWVRYSISVEQRGTVF